MNSAEPFAFHTAQTLIRDTYVFKLQRTYKALLRELLLSVCMSVRLRAQLI